MRKFIVLASVVILFIFITGCIGKTVVPVRTINKQYKKTKPCK